VKLTLTEARLLSVDAAQRAGRIATRVGGGGDARRADADLLVDADRWLEIAQALRRGNLVVTEVV
jgi:hypothetical protein